MLTFSLKPIIQNTTIWQRKAPRPLQWKGRGLFKFEILHYVVSCAVIKFSESPDCPHRLAASRHCQIRSGYRSKYGLEWYPGCHRQSIPYSSNHLRH